MDDIKNMRDSKFNLRKFYFTFSNNSIYRDRFLVIEATYPLHAIIEFKKYFGATSFAIYTESEFNKVNQDGIYTPLILAKEDLKLFKYKDYFVEATTPNSAWAVLRFLLSTDVNFYGIKQV